VCPFQVPSVTEKNVAYIELAKCQGCGVCVAECPAKAIQLAHFTDQQVLAETDALLAVEEGEK
jgi:heterodisulfide reductase subunit A-like polyferredoxin